MFSLDQKSQYRLWFIPYLEGTLDTQRKARLETALASDPALAADLAAMRNTVAHLSQSAGTAQATSAAATSNLWPGIQERLEREARRTQRPPSLFWAGGMCTAALLLIAFYATRTPLVHQAPQVKGAQIAQAPKTVPTAPPLIVTPRSAPTTLEAKPGAAKAPRAVLHPSLTAQQAPRVAKIALPVPVAAPKTAALKSMVVKKPQARIDVPVAKLRAPLQIASRDTGNHRESSDMVSPKPMTSQEVADAIHKNGDVFNSPTASVDGPKAYKDNMETMRDQPATHGSGNLYASPPPSASAPIATFGLNGSPPTGGFGGPENGAMGLRGASPGAGGFGGGSAKAMRTAAPDVSVGSWVSSLRSALQSSHYGSGESEQQVQRILNAAKAADKLPALRNALEQSSSIDAERALASVYVYTGEQKKALSMHKQITGRLDATAEDWYQYGTAARQAGSLDIARTAYAQALKISGSSLSDLHRAAAQKFL